MCLMIWTYIHFALYLQRRHQTAIQTHAFKQAFIKMNLKQRLNVIYFSLIRYCLLSYFCCFLAPRQNNMTSKLMGK